MKRTALGVPDFSPERRATALRYLRGERVMDRTDITDNARLVLTVGVLICDDVGKFTRRDLDAAMQDESIVQVARSLMAQAVL